MKMSSASLIFQTLINGLLFSTSVYSSIGSCHLDVPLSGYSHPCESGNQDFKKPLRGMVKDLGLLLVLEQDSIHSLLPAHQWHLPPEDHPVTVCHPERFLPPPQTEPEGIEQ